MDLTKQEMILVAQYFTTFGNLVHVGCNQHSRVCVRPVVDGDVEHGGAVVAVRVAVMLGRHGPQRHSPPLLLLPLEVAVVELEVFGLDRLGQGQLLGMADFWKGGNESMRDFDKFQISRRRASFIVNAT